MKAFDIAAFGMQAQSERLKLIAQNVANANSVSTELDGLPYRRKTISFKSVMDKELGIEKVVVDKIGVDNSAYVERFDPGNPTANDEGYVLLPNVNSLVEMTDMREAKASYQANLSVIEITKTMIARTLELLR